MKRRRHGQLAPLTLDQRRAKEARNGRRGRNVARVVKRRRKRVAPAQMPAYETRYRRADFEVLRGVIQKAMERMERMRRQ